MRKKRSNPRVSHQSPPGLSPREIGFYYKILSEEITDYDCGTLCAPMNGGVPFCCSTKIVLPLLYRSELAYLQELGDLWSVWNPGTSRSRRLLRGLSREELYCECRGVEHCIREQRSIACRTFPLEPYIDEEGRLAGLIFIADLASSPGKTLPEQRGQEEQKGENRTCPLLERVHDIRQEYIDSCFVFWKRFLQIPVEYETYRSASRSLRKRDRNTGEQRHIFYPGRDIRDPLP